MLRHLLLSWIVGSVGGHDAESAVRVVVELGLETGDGLAGRVDLETDGPAPVAGRVIYLDSKLDRGAVLVASWFISRTRPSGSAGCSAR